MKIIDDKGRLFDRINIIDLGIILFILVIIFSIANSACSLYLMSKNGKKGVIQKADKGLKVNYSRTSFAGLTVKIDVTVTFRDLDYNNAKLVSVGDSELDGNKMVIAKILSVEIAERAPIKIDLGGGILIASPFPAFGNDYEFKKDIKAVVRLTGEVKGTSFYFRGTPVTIDSIIEFDFGKYKLTGMVTGIQE